MNKKVLSIGVLLVIIVSVLSGCGKKDANKKKKVTINYGETCSIENKFELIVKANRIVERLTPPNPTGVYNYFWAGEGKKIVDISTELKNLTEDKIIPKDLMSAKMYVDDKEYDVFYVSENTAGSDLQGNSFEKEIEANGVRKLHFAAKVEKELLEKETTIKLGIKANNNEYTYLVNLVKDGESVKSEGATINLNYKGTTIKENQLISVPGLCDFTITKCQFTEKVEPSNPTAFHRYLPAKDGKLYVDLQVTVKNTQDKAVKQAQLPGSAVLYCGDKSYTVQTLVETAQGGDFSASTTQADINSSETRLYHLVATVPAEVKDSKDTLWFRITASDTKYIFKIR
ncbi:MAG: hypothetical protein K6B70_05945 [Clostridia bacterium]|nr:hypothetical protein [Clostridia bacterium]